MGSAVGLSYPVARPPIRPSARAVVLVQGVGIDPARAVVLARAVGIVPVRDVAFGQVVGIVLVPGVDLVLARAAENDLRVV